MMAAVAAAQYGAQVTLIEKNAILGKKIRITGKGRCNVTNHCDRDTFLAAVQSNPRFLYSAYAAWSCEDTMRFFEERGVPLKTERGARVFPVSDRAADIAEALRAALKELRVRILTAEAAAILSEQGAVCGVRTTAGVIPCDCAVVATGGVSYPGTGSTGDGYRFAEAAGHTIVPPKPSLVPIETEEPWCRDAMGLSLRNVSVKLIDTQSGKTLFTDFGEMLFTHFGVSGPLILSASAHIKQPDRGRYQLRINLKPALSDEQLDARILRDFEEAKNREFKNALGKLLPAKLIPIVVRLCGIPPEKPVHSVTRAERAALMHALRELTVTFRKFRPIAEAIVTAGGVQVSELRAATMESKKVEGLFFAGEVLDVDAYTGGFNLQIAFSTGYLAGRSAAEKGWQTA